jgi:hypothetical protein
MQIEAKAEEAEKEREKAPMKVEEVEEVEVPGSSGASTLPKSIAVNKRA